MIKIDDEKYGKSPFNPIRIKGIKESIEFINLLVTEEDEPFLYHRLRSISVDDSKPIDCYEILKPRNEKDYLFIDSYSIHENSTPPEGYLFKTKKTIPTVISGFFVTNTLGVNYKLRKFPDELF
jgi:hypothetical protein